MDAVKFVKEEIRMCAEANDCIDCPLYNTDYCSVSPKKRPQEEAEKIVALVEEWAAAHPRKIRQDVFLEQWPNAKIDEDTGVLNICPADLDERYRDARNRCNIRSTQTGTCDHCRKEFWTQEVK